MSLPPPNPLGAPFGPPPGYQPYGGVPTPQGTSGFAIASLVCSLAGVFCGLPAILGVVFGGIALSQTKNNARGGRGMAIAGIVIGTLICLSWIVVVMILVSFGNSL